MSVELTNNGLKEELCLTLKGQALNFLKKCRTDTGLYKLTTKSDSSPFALCFAVFLYQLIGCLNNIKSDFPFLSDQIAKEIYLLKKKRERIVDLKTDKVFLQLLCFSLSSLYLLNSLKKYPLSDIVETVLPHNIEDHLKKIGAYDGVPQSGNLSMFTAILNIYGRDYLGMKNDDNINIWINGHLKHINKYGCWGKENITHLQFQNAYHQYEIFEFLKIESPNILSAINLVKTIADKRGQFAPYYGGSGCYDYDAISFLTSPSYILESNDFELLATTVKTILHDQNKDGGFSESQFIRPRSLSKIKYGIKHVFSARGSLQKERLKYFIALLLPKNDSINTHWSNYSRQWGESNLWDTWFRLLTLARIDTTIKKENLQRWGFINFPGIGFHHNLRN